MHTHLRSFLEYLRLNRNLGETVSGVKIKCLMCMRDGT